jgi:hypothetical protein
MRKLFALLLVASAFTFAACEQKTETTSDTADTVSVPAADTSAEGPATDPGVEPIAPDSAAKDSAAGHAGH